MELSLGLGMVAVLLMVILPLGASVIVQAKGQAQQQRLRTLVTYCEEYLMQHGDWPAQELLPVKSRRQGVLLVLEEDSMTATAYPKVGGLLTLAYENIKK